MSTDTLIQLYASDLLLARPLWHSHPLGISPKVWTLNILDLGQRHCPHGGGNKSVGPRFHLFQLFGLLGPISVLSSPFSCHGKVAVASGTTPPPPPHKHLTGGQRVGTSIGTTYNAFLVFPVYVQLPEHVQWEMFDLPKKKEEGIHFLADLSTWCSQ